MDNPVVGGAHPTVSAEIGRFGSESLAGMDTQAQPSPTRRWERCALAGIALLFVGLSVIGISWGLPTACHDKYLFGETEPWSGVQIQELAGGADKFDRARGADVDVDPLDKDRLAQAPIPLNADPAQQAAIYQRYRLYTHQPDEMITLMALAGMQPGELKLDPKLYQYGGLFIYPVGALLKVCSLLGLIDVRGDLGFYLGHPDEFGKFYIVARTYAAAWGVLGVLVVFGIGRRLGGCHAGWLGALFYTLLPVVICMAHEGKPHLPGAVLMLLAVWFALRHLDHQAGPRPEDQRKSGRHNWWLMCICCGAAFGMVLSSLPIFILIPLVALLDLRQPRMTVAGAAGRTLLGAAVGIEIYLLTNPYLVINAFTNRAVLASNFGNSLAMYEIDRLGEGFVRVWQLTVEGATLPLVLLGICALFGAWARRCRNVSPLVVPALVFFAQFVLIGAGKPAEYGRFGIFTNTCLALGTACLLAWAFRDGMRRVTRMVVVLLIALTTALGGGRYLYSFGADAWGFGQRAKLAEWIAQYPDLPVLVFAEPAPYCCPPLRFNHRPILLCASAEQALEYARNNEVIVLRAVDSLSEGGCISSLGVELAPGGDVTLSAFADSPLAQSPISWANKPFCAVRAGPTPAVSAPATLSD